MYSRTRAAKQRERKETKEVGKGVKISSGKNKSGDWRIDRETQRGERERDIEEVRKSNEIVTKTQKNHTK